MNNPIIHLIFKKMKNIIILSLFTLLFCSQINAQISINKNTLEPSAILDFPAGTNKGIILPIISTLPTNAVDGTILMDKNDLKIKMKQNGKWVDLSGIGSVAGVSFNPSNEIPTASLIIGASNSLASGVLVLESNNKALILPKVNAPHLNVKSPAPGMVCYDTASDSMAIFDGVNWSFWK
jgi:hypothetical protein